MKTKSAIVILAAILAAATIVSANPIPVPPPANMPLEEMYIEIQPDGNGLYATVTGDFTFVSIPKDVNSMLFPVPPDANNIRVREDSNELPWTWSSEEYPTILPEMPNIPMIEWQGPFHPNGSVFSVYYEHDLIERPNDFIFFYALGTGKYFPTYEKTTTAHIDILLPVGYTVQGVFLDDVPHAYQLDGYHLMLTVRSCFGPIIHDLIVSLVKDPAGNDCNGNFIPDGGDLAPQVDFPNAVDYGVGDRPFGVTCADLNGDSIADLTVTDTNSDNISVLMNNGDGTFTSAVDYIVGDFPVAVTAGDFDRDGDVDLALANDHSDNISVLLNNGNGTFSSKTDYAVGDGPCSIKTADLNSDSNLDLMVANKWDQSVSLLFNNGNGTFVRAADYIVGKYPGSITCGDFNRDTKADLAVGAGYSLAILLNNGNGAFAPAIYYDVGGWPEFVTSGDFDTDGDPDLAVADNGLNIVLILFNDGTGTFTPGPKYGMVREPSCIIAPDLEDDGDLAMSVSATTRAPRPGEVDGKDYFFLEMATFETMVAKGEFLEHARVFDNMYGTPKGPVEEALKSGKDVLFDVDWQGTQQLAENAADDLVRVFVLPPSIEELERRLHTRAQDSDEVVKKRMSKAASEMSHWAEYDYVIVNIDIDDSVNRVKSILTAERLKRRRQVGLSDFVGDMCEGY